MTQQPERHDGLHRWLLLAILLLGVVLRLHHLTAPLADTHNWRQTQTAMITRNLYRDGFNLWSPHVDFYCTAEICSESGLLVLEFPLYNTIVALLYKIFGMREILGRLVSIGFSIGAALLLYRFTSRLSGTTVALFATLYFILSPLSVFYGRAFMPESLMLFAGIGALLYFHDWLQNERWLTFTIAIIFTITTSLVKLPMIHILIPMAYMAWAQHGRGLFRKKALALFLILSLVPPAIWSLHSATSPNLGMTWLLSDLNLLRGKELYLVIWKRLGQDVLTSVGRALFVLGLFLGLRKKGERVLDIWFGATILYVLALGRGNAVHHYYQLPLLPMAVIYIGKAMALLPRLGLRRFLWLPVTALLIVATGAESLKITKPWYGEEIQGLYQFAETVKRTTPAGSPIMLSSSFINFAPWDPRLLYAFDRRGWNIRPENLLQSLQQPAKRRADYLVMYPTEGLEPGLMQQLLTRYRLLAVQKPRMTGLVFDLAVSETRVQVQPIVREGFESENTARDRWESWGEGFSISSKERWKGLGSLLLQAAPGGYRLLKHGRIEIHPESIYLARVRVRTEYLEGSGAGIFHSTYSASESSSQLSADYALVPPGEGWREASLLFTPPEGARSLLIGLGGVDIKGTVWFDDFELLEIRSKGPGEALREQASVEGHRNPSGRANPQ
jgi:hypothetical protein